jgi:S1-C subfamily serine protease
MSAPPYSSTQRRRHARRRRARGVASIALLAGVIGGVAVLGAEHAAGIAGLVTGSGSSSQSVGASQGSGSLGSGGIVDPSLGGGASGDGSSGGSSSGGSGSSSGGAAAGTAAPGAGAPANAASIAAKIDPALVDVNATFGYQRASGAGTGVVISSDGEVITNNHVVNGATSISVTDVGNGRTYAATVAGYDAAHDIAVLRLADAGGLATASLGDSSSVVTGQPVVAVGNAGGVGGTPSAAGGSVTGLGRSVTAGDELNGTTERLTGMIGVNANIQPGDSGGSLVNTAGQVIGIDTAGSAGSTDVDYASRVEGFAVPINTVMSIVHQVESGQGTSTVHVGRTAFLGISTDASVSQGAGGQSGDSGGGTAASGATIAGVVSGGAAARAGLVAGDVITAFDGHDVAQASDITNLLVPHHPGDAVSVSWTDTSGQAHTAQVTLGSGPSA